jgi:hypothetical protein
MTPTDDELLQTVADLYAELDPAPGDLADGVLARMAVEGLETEYELLTLVERVDVAAGTRTATGTESAATVALEFAGSTYRVLVRISNDDGVRRLDGWVVPAVPMRVFLGSDTDAITRAQLTSEADRDGRFEFSAPSGSLSGEVRLWLLPLGDDTAATGPFVTPRFHV